MGARNNALSDAHTLDETYLISVASNFEVAIKDAECVLVMNSLRVCGIIGGGDECIGEPDGILKNQVESISADIATASLEIGVGIDLEELVDIELSEAHGNQTQDETRPQKNHVEDGGGSGPGLDKKKKRKEELFELGPCLWRTAEKPLYWRMCLGVEGIDYFNFLRNCCHIQSITWFVRYWLNAHLHIMEGGPCSPRTQGFVGLLLGINLSLGV